MAQGSPGQYQEGEYDSYYYGEGESEETVTEIVEERVEEIQSEDLEMEMQDVDQQETDRINNYLEVDKDQYMNNEYAINQRANDSPEKGMHEFEYEQDPQVYKNAVSPIIEDQRENDETLLTSKSHLRYRSKIYPHSGSHRGGSKNHLVWERERKARNRAAKKAQAGLYQYAGLDLSSNPALLQYISDHHAKRMEFNNKPARRSEMWQIQN